MTPEFLSWVNPILIAAVAFFLHQLVGSVKEMAKDIGDIKITIATHSAKVDDMDSRVNGIESKLTQQEHDIKEFYRKYGAKLNEN